MIFISLNKEKAFRSQEDFLNTNKQHPKQGCSICAFYQEKGGNAMNFEKVMATNEYNERCARALDMLAIFMADAEQHNKKELSLDTLSLILGTVGKRP